MNYRLIVKDRATQDLQHLANYILVNGNADVAGKFLDAEIGRRGDVEKFL
ncbi:MAG: hypothetical protein KME21_28710 [Desmonostoc vinosum HA7617-LM4]|jgi:toxin ParE1/3/4|nr:hypothetical protein [Desmonostoc vinosum HA7617-LM4]